MVPALFPLGSCVCGVVQDIKSSSQTDPFPLPYVLSGAVRAKRRRLKCCVRRVRFTGRYCSFLGFSVREQLYQRSGCCSQSGGDSTGCSA